MRKRFLPSVILLLGGVAFGQPVGTPVELGLAGYAKVLCSAVFVSYREPAEAFHNSGYWMMPNDKQDGITYVVDREAKVVRITRDGITRSAKFYGDQGCIIQKEEGIHFTPVAVKTRLPDADSQPWPMGDQTLKDTTDIDHARIAKAVDLAFADPDGLTAAFLVVYKGQIVAERYMPGITKDTQLESWSMGKSLTATLFALLVKDGVYRLEDPAPVPEWHAPGDPRAAIRIVDLMHMSSGLRFIATQDPDYKSSMGYADHWYVYTGAVDVFQYSLSRPLQFPPNTEGRYRNCDPLTIGWLIKQAMTKRGEEYLTFPQRALFDRIGIRRQVLETDPYGNFLLTGYDYGTARNWARLGMLYLQDGVWQGTRILPEGWAKFVSTPAPAWKKQNYGGLFWVNGDGTWNLPKTAYLANGAGGQKTFVIPSHNLVVVRMGHFRGDRAGMKALNKALGELIAAVPSTESAN
ncbi:MAG TPA: serine hydrolase [Bryobacteraceae bacterium]|nr:serine hydrolase [Bryobacteraceae bacterium]